MNCELCENSLVYSIPYSRLEAMLDEHPGLAKFAFYTVLEITRKISGLMAGIKFQTAEERYNTLMQDFPSVFQRAQLGHIASFLGITQETLSRIRAGK